jgi:hypothetical protein
VLYLLALQFFAVMVFKSNGVFLPGIGDLDGDIRLDVEGVFTIN